MQVARAGVFETNSSSSHSISVRGDGKCTDRLPLTAEGVCVIFPGEFGWGRETHTDVSTKASYLMTWLKSSRDNYDVDVSKEEAMLITVIKEQTGAKNVVFAPNSSQYYPWGYIDHQSVEPGGCNNPGLLAFQNEQFLISFLFNPHSELVIDNDNG